MIMMRIEKIHRVNETFKRSCRSRATMKLPVCRLWTIVTLDWVLCLVAATKPLYYGVLITFVIRDTRSRRGCLCQKEEGPPCPIANGLDCHYSYCGLGGSGQFPHTQILQAHHKFGAHPINAFNGLTFQYS